ncbi:MAG: PH domain-containing protein [Acidimicrobiia bacterium]
MTAVTEVAAAPLDRATRVVTGFVVVLFAVLAVAMVAVPGPGLVARLLLPTVFVGVLALSWALAPRGYATAPGQLVVQRRGFRPRTYAVTADAPVTWPAGMRGVRLLGSGGLFGYYGTFWTRELGRYRAHVTDRRRTVLVRTPKGPVIISPADVEAFLATVWKGPR